MDTINEFDIDSIVEEAFESPQQQEVEEIPIPQLPEPQLPETPKERMPLNTLPVDTSVSRFSSAEWFDKMAEIRVTIAGLGGIGSWLAFLVGRLKPYQLYLYDDDVVDNTNMSGQLYSVGQVGISKCTTSSRNISDFANYYSTFAMVEKFTSLSPCTEILMCGFDNMSARIEAFSSWKRKVLEVPVEKRKEFLFVDGRLAAEEFQVFCMTGEDEYLMDKYASEWLFADTQAEETICSYKQTSFCANMIASTMTNLLVNFVTNLCDPIIKRELPFKTVYDASLMRFITEMS